MNDETRVEHYRGPGRGTGRSRSIAWHEQRRDALTRPCSYELLIPAQRGVPGAKPSRLPCGAGIGQLCRDPRTDEVLERQAAHVVRMSPTSTPTRQETR